uniref:Uncharacterized protein n=1 Tax=Physcomitrium patens TaxID=3218 RepID=A0A2K1L092_PHYPA|nr:hypothetical protein PHYPA_002233 [Physcomitrium patens]
MLSSGGSFWFYLKWVLALEARLRDGGRSEWGLGSSLSVREKRCGEVGAASLKGCCPQSPIYSCVQKATCIFLIF